MAERLKKAQGAIRIALFLVISIVFGVGIYRWNAESLTGNVIPMPFGVGMGVVMSGSMEPELSVDDVIFVVASDEYVVDDVVVFQQNNILVVHKIIQKDGDTIITQGTANDTPDEEMDVSVVKGKVLFHIDGLGGFVTWVKSPLGTFCLLGIAVAFLVWSYAAERKDKDDETEQLEAIKREIERLKASNATETPSDTTEEQDPS